MNALPAIQAALAGDSTIESLVQFLPNDIRANYVYTTWLTRDYTPDAFMQAEVDTLWPSIFLSAGSPVRHPQDYKVPFMTVIYPQVWCYMPMLNGIDPFDRSRKVLQRAREILHDMAVADPDTLIPGRLGWFGDVAGRQADEYKDTWTESSLYEYRARWRNE